MLFEVFLHNKVFNQKDPCITKEQSLSIHDVVSDQGFAMHYRVILNTVNHLEVFRCERQFVRGKAKVRKLTSFLMLNVSEANRSFNMISRRA